MRNSGPVPVSKDLVLIGGGHSHVAVLRRFGMRPMPGVRITVIARELHTPYSGMLPGFVAGLYGYDDIHIDLAPLCTFAGARLYHDEAVGLDLAARRVLCAARPPVPYDVLSIDTGSTPHTDGVPGAGEHAVPVKPISTFIPQWEALRTRVLQRAGRSRIAVVGEGAGGVELLMAVEARLRREFHQAGRPGGEPEYHIFARSERLLPRFAPAARDRVERILTARGITIHGAGSVTRVEAGVLRTDRQESFEVDEVLWVTSAGAPQWPRDSGLAVDDQGFIAVAPTLESLSHPGVFATGDVAAVAEHPRPKAGVIAVRQGPPLAENLRRALAGRPLRPFRPQRSFLAILGNGERCGIAVRGPWALEGRWVWAWKDWIDRRFMQRYADLPRMAADPAPAASVDEEGSAADGGMRCGGCGAKVGSTVLTAALGRLQPLARPDILVGLSAADDAAVAMIPPGKLTVHTVDYFRSIVDDPYLFGQIAANHSLGDLFAMGAEPQSALAIVTLPYGLQSKLEDTLFQLMSGATKVIGESGASLAGGHTSEGAELAMGFALNGLVDADAILRKSGMQPGHSLLLTKPLGTGTLFAAGMRGKAKGRWLDAALNSMVQSSRLASETLIRHGATACTDVTGFGLIGHLLEMTGPSGVDVELDLRVLPVFDGALETAREGIVSSLQPQNLRAARSVRQVNGVAAQERYPLLFDPQTAGGLLASVPAENAETCLAALHAAGYGHAAAIGRVLPRGNHAEPIALV